MNYVVAACWEFIIEGRKRYNKHKRGKLPVARRQSNKERELPQNKTFDELLGGQGRIKVSATNHRVCSQRGLPIACSIYSVTVKV